MLPTTAKLILLSLPALLPAGRIWGQSTIYVDSRINVPVCHDYEPASRTCGTGLQTAYRTIAGVLPVAFGGTSVLIREGNYSEPLAPVNSGTPGNPVTFRSYVGETVRLNAAPAISLINRSHLVIDGMRVENTTWLEARNAHSNVLQNCVFLKTPATGTTGNVRFVQSHYNRILYNTFDEGHDNLLLIDSNFNVVEGNTLREGRHSLLGIRCGDHNIVRGNFFSNTQQKICEVYDCGADTSAVPHSFNSTRRNLIENNVFAEASAYYSSSGGNGIQYSGQQGIIRRNVFYRCNIGLGMQVYSDEAIYNTGNHVDHNVFYENSGAGIATSSSATDNHYRNNILFANRGALPDCFGTSPGQLLYRSRPGSTSSFRNNDLFYQSSGQPVIEEEFSGGKTIAQATAAFPGVFSQTMEVDPRFVDAPGHDFHLQTDSPMRDAGAWLTETNGSGSGRVLTVAAAGMFHDGFGIPGESGDLIQLEGQSQSVRVKEIDYDAGKITVDRDIVWSSGQGVGLAYGGSAPDVGAFEFADQLPPDRIELWRYLEFANDAGNPSIAGDLADPDRDGVCNLLEYGLGGRPLAPDAAVLPRPGSEPAALSLTFQHDETLTDLTWEVQGAGSLTEPPAWETIARGTSGAPLAAVLPGVTVTKAGEGSVTTVTVSDLSSSGSEAGRRFLRLQLSRQQ
jgi:hypothetical protein